MTPRRSACAIGALAIGVAVAACAPESSQRSTPSTRPAERVTCEAIELGRVPDDLLLVDRTLEPLGGIVSGPVFEYRNGPGRSIVVTSGGSLDDAVEAYDDLSEGGVVERPDGRVNFLVGEFFGRRVHAALWRDPSLPSPCDGRAVVTEGLTDDEFSALLDSRS